MCNDALLCLADSCTCIALKSNGASCNETSMDVPVPVTSHAEQIQIPSQNRCDYCCTRLLSSCMILRSTCWMLYVRVSGHRMRKEKGTVRKNRTCTCVFQESRVKRNGINIERMNNQSSAGWLDWLTTPFTYLVVSCTGYGPTTGRERRIPKEAKSWRSVSP